MSGENCAGRGVLIQKNHWVIATVGCVLAAMALMLMRDLKILYQIAFWVGLMGGAALLVFPQRRMALVVAWILAYPLSLEKVITSAESPHPSFIPYTLIISGADVILYVLAVWLLVEARLTGRTLRGIWPKAATPFAVLAAWVVVAFFLDGPSLNGLLQIIHWAKMLFIMVVMAAAIRTRDEFVVVLAALAVAVLLQSLVVGVAYGTKRQISVQGASTEVLGFSSGDETYKRASGTLGHNNQQASFHTFFTLPLIGLLAARNFWWKSGGLIVIGGSMIALLLIFSRGAWLSCVVAGVVILGIGVVKGRMSRPVWLCFCGAALAGLIVLACLAKPISDRLTRGDDGASASRIRMVVMALQNMVQAPVTGIGPGNFIEAQLKREPLAWRSDMWIKPGQNIPHREITSIEYSGVEAKGQKFIVPLQVHNKFLLILSELGLIGLFLYLWYQWRVFCAALYCLKSRDGILWWSALGLTGAVVASQVYGMVDLFYDDKSVLLIMFFNILIMALYRIVQKEQLARVRPSVHHPQGRPDLIPA